MIIRGRRRGRMPPPEDRYDRFLEESKQRVRDATDPVAQAVWEYNRRNIRLSEVIPLISEAIERRKIRLKPRPRSTALHSVITLYNRLPEEERIKQMEQTKKEIREMCAGQKIPFMEPVLSEVKRGLDENNRRYLVNSAGMIVYDLKHHIFYM